MSGALASVIQLASSRHEEPKKLRTQEADTRPVQESHVSYHVNGSAPARPRPTSLNLCPLSLSSSLSCPCRLSRLALALD